MLLEGKSSWVINSTFYCIYSNFYTSGGKNHGDEYYAVFIGVLILKNFRT